MAKPSSKEKPVELLPDGWERFERAVDAAVKGGPHHRKAKASGKKKWSPKRRSKAQPKRA
jgi:hypothetical protein